MYSNGHGYIHWKECVIIISMFNLIMTASLILYMPESPSWLFVNKKEGDNMQSLYQE